MKEKKSSAFSLRLPVSMIEQITAIANATNRDRTGVITEAIALYLAQSGPARSQDAGLSQVVELLQEISDKLSHNPQRNVIRKMSDAVTQKPPATTVRPPVTTPRPPVTATRFIAVDPDADALIIRMTMERATLPAISSALNALGFVCATGQEWTQSRVRDYRHKLRARGLIE